MNTSTVEQQFEETQVEKEPEAPCFEMPKPEIGQIVRVHPNGDKEHTGFNCLVYRVNNLTVGVQALDEGRLLQDQGELRHVDDPLLQENAYVRRQGAWDFTPLDKERARRDAILLQKLEEVTKLSHQLKGKLEGLAALQARVAKLEKGAI